MKGNKIMDRDSIASQVSTSLQMVPDTNYLSCIESLSIQNQYFRDALQSADNLIKSYQKDNQFLKKENGQLRQKLLSIDAGQSLYFRSKLAEKPKLYFLQSTETQTVDGIEKPEKDTTDQIPQLIRKMKLLIESQEKYEQKIRYLQNKTLLFERQSQLEGKPKQQQHLFSLGLSQMHYETKNSSLIEQNKHKKLYELRALHLKMNPSQKKYEDQSCKTENNNLTIVSRVFSAEKLCSQSSTTTPIKKKKYLNNNKSQRSVQKLKKNNK